MVCLVVKVLSRSYPAAVRMPLSGLDAGEPVLSRAGPEQSRRVEGPVEPLVVSLSNQALPFDWLRGIMASKMNRYFAILAAWRPIVNAGAEP